MRRVCSRQPMGATAEGTLLSLMAARAASLWLLLPMVAEAAEAEAEVAEGTSSCNYRMDAWPSWSRQRYSLKQYNTLLYRHMLPYCFISRHPLYDRAQPQ